MKIKIASIFGTRPDTIKMCPLVKELKKHSDVIQSITIGTAQHRQMMDQVLDVFDVSLDYDLGIMKDRQTLTDITCGCLSSVKEVLEFEKPDMVLVHGDTSTGFSSALAAFYSKIKIGHVEAGLRTNQKYDPYPEEMNRRLIGTLADLHFAPTMAHKENLIREGINENSVYVTGNTAIDAVMDISDRSDEYIDEDLRRADFSGKRVILVTTHRRENIGQPMIEICEAIKRITLSFPDCMFVFPVHLNPLVREIVTSSLGDVKRCVLINPVSYPDVVKLMKASYMVMSDSGGIQEEAPALNKPVLVLRKTTERPEGVACGTLRLSGVTSDEIFNDAELLLTNRDVYSKMADSKNPYGDGQASRRIVESILHSFGFNKRPEDFSL